MGWRGGPAGRRAFPPGNVDVTDWPACALLLPHALAVIDHAQRFYVEREATACCLTSGFYLGAVASTGRP